MISQLQIDTVPICIDTCIVQAGHNVAVLILLLNIYGHLKKKKKKSQI